MRSSTPAFLLALLLLFPGVALATGPLPAYEVDVDVGDRDVGHVRDGISEKREEVPEECTPRPLVLCVSPFDPDVNYEFGNTGVLVRTNDTNASVGHDPHREWVYGPYTFPEVVLEEVRLCNSGCSIPNSLYAHVQGNITIVVFVTETEYSTTASLGSRDIGLPRPGVLEPTCQLQRWYDCTPLV